MYMATMKRFVAGLALISFASAPVLAADGAPTEIKPVGLFSKKVEDCAKDAKNGKKNGKKNGDKKAGCDDDKGAKKNGCDVGCGDGECNLLQRAMNKLGLGRSLSDRGVKVGGWTQLGYHSDGPLHERADRFNNHPDNLNVHQMWFYAEKRADGSDGLGLGFRGDLIYGVDAQDLQSNGNEAGVFDNEDDWDRGGGYGWAMPQLYAEVASGDVSARIGHFLSIVGYEKAQAPQNFFYSHANTMYNSEPRTHTGILVDYSPIEELTLTTGYALGWNTGFSQQDDGSLVIAAATFELEDLLTVSYATTFGDLGDGRGEGYMHSVTTSVELQDNLTYAFQSDVLETNETFQGSAGETDDDNIGINQYLIYKIDDKLSAGARVEWWKYNGTSINEVTFGINYRPRKCIVVRPEVRTDWSSGLAEGAEDRTTFGIDMILSY